MHINVHVGLGIILATIAGQFIDLTFWSFGFIIFFSIFPDFDIVFKKYAFEKNHRNLFTHSIYLALIMLIFGLIFNSELVLFGGIGYIIHLITDTFDWGCDLFYQKKNFGLSLLLSNEERENLLSILENYKIHQFFFIERYYHSNWVIVTEIIIFLTMSYLIFFIVAQFWYFIFLYFIALTVHFIEYFEVKHQNGGGQQRFRLIPH